MKRLCASAGTGILNPQMGCKGFVGGLSSRSRLQWHNSPPVPPVYTPLYPEPYVLQGYWKFGLKVHLHEELSTVWTPGLLGERPNPEAWKLTFPVKSLSLWTVWTVPRRGSGDKVEEVPIKQDKVTHREHLWNTYKEQNMDQTLHWGDEEWWGETKGPWNVENGLRYLHEWYIIGTVSLEGSQQRAGPRPRSLL